MRVSAILTQTGDNWLAQCEEVDRAGEGNTPDEAIASLRDALAEYFGNEQAVAPPPEPIDPTIEIVVVDAPANATGRFTR